MKSCEALLDSAREIYDKVFQSKIYSFSSIVRSELPEEAGVYVIWLKKQQKFFMLEEHETLSRGYIQTISWVISHRQG